jgi:hypothetical protein
MADKLADIPVPSENNSEQSEIVAARLERAFRRFQDDNEMTELRNILNAYYLGTRR